jgi:hypothetical protein
MTYKLKCWGYSVNCSFIYTYTIYTISSLSLLLKHNPSSLNTTWFLNGFLLLIKSFSQKLFSLLNTKPCNQAQLLIILNQPPHPPCDFPLLSPPGSYSPLIPPPLLHHLYCIKLLQSFVSWTLATLRNQLGVPGQVWFIWHLEGEQSFLNYILDGVF